MNDKIILMASLSNAFGMEKTNARLYLLRNGFKFFKVRGSSTGMQIANAMSYDDGLKACEVRKKDGFIVKDISPDFGLLLVTKN